MVRYAFATSTGEHRTVTRAELGYTPEIGGWIEHKGERLKRLATNIEANLSPHTRTMPTTGSRSLPRRMPGFQHNALGQTCITSPYEAQRAAAMTNTQRS